MSKFTLDEQFKAFDRASFTVRLHKKAPEMFELLKEMKIAYESDKPVAGFRKKR